MLQSFQQNWNQYFNHLTPANSHLFVAVSGGLDSVVLTHLLALSSFSFTILHCNFQLRGEESERDENFVQSLGAKYNKPVLVKRFDTQLYAEQNKVSIQVAARELRYSWFEEMVNCQQSTVNSKLLTAHHADDNIETVLMNIFRGTGIKGLHGIWENQGYIIRPLLFAKRTAIKAYAEQEQLSWVEDSSNSSDKYARNFFRHHIIPLVKEVYANADDNLLNNIEKWKETEHIYDGFIAEQKKQLLEKKGNEIHIPVLKLAKQKPLKTIVHEIITDFGFTAAQVKDVLNLLNADSGKYVASTTHKIIKNRNWLIITPIVTKEAANILIEENDTTALFEAGKINIEKATLKDFSISNDNNCVYLDAANIQFPLLLRKCKTGDYFYPLGMKKKKKLSRFFIDNKLSKTQKENIWVIESNKKIIWVVGYRIDDRFKVKEQSQQLLQLTVS